MGRVSVTAHAASILMKKYPSVDWRDHLSRALRSGGRMDLHLVVLPQGGSRSLPWMFTLRSTLPLLHDGIHRLATTTFSSTESDAQLERLIQSNEANFNDCGSPIIRFGMLILGMFMSISRTTPISPRKRVSRKKKILNFDSQPKCMHNLFYSRLEVLKARASHFNCIVIRRPGKFVTGQGSVAPLETGVSRKPGPPAKTTLLQITQVVNWDAGRRDCYCADRLEIGQVLDYHGGLGECHCAEAEAEKSYADTLASAGPNLTHPALITALTSNSAAAIAFGLDLSVVSRLGGHAAPRTHRDKTRAVQLLQDGGAVVGVEYELSAGDSVSARGTSYWRQGTSFSSCAFIKSLADASPTGLLAQHRPELRALPTTNADHATGDLDQVQVHPTGFVSPSAPDAWIKFLAAEALRGAGKLLMRAGGDSGAREARFRRESGGGGDFYVSKGLMKRYADASAFAEDAGIPLESILGTFAGYGAAGDPFGSDTANTAPYTPTEPLHVVIITPVMHYYCIFLFVEVPSLPVPSIHPSIPFRLLTRIRTGRWAALPSTPPHASSPRNPLPPNPTPLYAASKVIGGVHGRDCLAGLSLLEAVVKGLQGPGA
ncbi:hypothetical protein C8F04DRAFT_1398826 [Mycena alexandri]|uniref:Uncharacterized protein n=1 Tax=Mycena alexandri TaxID=1745969 RepID=A0AAD6WXA5_9AGAR|nr:hypothetical protein C8F04DRAFT_1398826 [Mycena alexandri]